MTFKKISAAVLAATAAVSLAACSSGNDEASPVESIPLEPGHAVGMDTHVGTEVYRYQGRPTPLAGADTSSPKSAGTTTVEVSCSGYATAWSDGDAGRTDDLRMTPDSRHSYVFAASDPGAGGQFTASITPDDPHTACGANVYDGDHDDDPSLYTFRGTVVVRLDIPANPNA